MPGTEQSVQASTEYAREVRVMTSLYVQADQRIPRIIVYTSFVEHIVVDVQFQFRDRFVGVDEVRPLLGRSQMPTEHQAGFLADIAAAAGRAWMVFAKEGTQPARMVQVFHVPEDTMETFYAYDDITCGRAVDPATLAAEWVARLRATGDSSPKPFVP